MSKKRILVIGSTSTSLINFRGDFLRSLKKEDFDVYAAAGSWKEEVYQILEDDYGVKPLKYDLQRTGLNPLNDLKTISQLKKLIKENNIDLVFPYTVKPVIYSSIAANSQNVPVISLITGLGFTFTGLTTKAKLLQFLNEFLYKRYVRKNKAIIFQNVDDKNLFLSRKVLSVKNRIEVVSGSGVNLDRFKFKENYNDSGSGLSFLFIARLIKEKGIGLYIEAAKVLKSKYPNVKFHVIGPAQDSPSAIKVEELNTLNQNGTLIWHGLQKNIVDHLTKRDVFVLPSYYREGVPRSILEALSVGLPIITTDSPGCRETVKINSNGFLIPPKNLEELINSMEFFIKNPNEIRNMGIKSRAYAEERFDVDIVNNDLIKIIKSVL